MDRGEDPSSFPAVTSLGMTGRAVFGMTGKAALGMTGRGVLGVTGAFSEDPSSFPAVTSLGMTGRAVFGMTGKDVFEPMRYVNLGLREATRLIYVVMTENGGLELYG